MRPSVFFRGEEVQMRKLCAVFAHPDDETYTAAGTLARYADQGAEVALVTATSGEAGEVGSAPVEKKDLAAWREQELGEAAAILNIRQVRLLRLPDTGLKERAEDLYVAIKSTLDELRPQVVITEDAHGITGHPDHIAVTRAVVRAFDDLSGPLKLYEHALPESIAREGLHGTPDDYITTTLDVEPWRERILAAFRAHRSQVSDEDLAYFRGFRPPWLNRYVCVRTRVPILIPEDDLFAGISD
jgi:LmbE family N-acetylglucosaminyl deacetylase